MTFSFIFYHLKYPSHVNANWSKLIIFHPRAFFNTKPNASTSFCISHDTALESPLCPNSKLKTNKNEAEYESNGRFLFFTLRFLAGVYSFIRIAKMIMSVTRNVHSMSEPYSQSSIDPMIHFLWELLIGMGVMMFDVWCFAMVKRVCCVSFDHKRTSFCSSLTAHDLIKKRKTPEFVLHKTVQFVRKHVDTLCYIVTGI